MFTEVIYICTKIIKNGTYHIHKQTKMEIFAYKCNLLKSKDNGSDYVIIQTMTHKHEQIEIQHHNGTKLLILIKQTMTHSHRFRNCLSFE